MNIFDELSDIYFEIDNDYTIIEAEARSRGHYRKEEKYKRKKELNDQAYFLFMFTRLEDRIRELSNELIDEKYTKLRNWNYKRTWDILHKRKENINLLDRVALLTELGQADYNLIERYYQQRNKIGHGKSFTITINIATVVNDMQRLYKDLQY